MSPRPHREPRPGRRIVAHGKQFAVKDKAGVLLSTWPTFEAACIELGALIAADAARKAGDAVYQDRLRAKRLYREAGTPGTELHRLVRFLPRQGQVEQFTRHVYRSASIFSGTNFDLIEREKKARARRAALQAAHAANARKGATTDSQVLKRLNELTHVPKRKRAAIVAESLDLTPAYVRKILNRANALLGKPSIPKKHVGKTIPIDSEVSPCPLN
jgi:hypothetical protein